MPSGLSEGRDSRIPVPFGEALAVRTHDKRQMKVENARRFGKRPAKQYLRRRRRKQIVAAHYFRHAHRKVVNGACKRVASPEFVARKGKIAKH